MTFSFKQTVFAASFAVLAMATAMPAAQAAETTYPLTFKNCGRDVTFTHAPERTVSIGQSTTEILSISPTLAAASVFIVAVVTVLFVIAEKARPR